MAVGLLVTLFLSSLSLHVNAINNGIGLTPPMGWNTWNHYRTHYTADTLKQTASAIANGPLGKAGYKFVNCDDVWMANSRTKSGALVPDPKKFPDGIEPVIKFVHDHGLKFGLYSSASDKTCQGRPASLFHETQDANTFAKWGIDYLKYDDCGNYDISTNLKIAAMRDALNATGHRIFFSTEPHLVFPEAWATHMSNSWRTGIDIKDNWDSVLLSLYTANRWTQAGFGGIGGWNDPDMLEVGNGGLTVTEEIAHFSLWCLLKAPLLMGNDIVNASKTTIDILSNVEAVAMNQDPLGIPGKLVDSYGDGSDKRLLSVTECHGRAERVEQYWLLNTTAGKITTTDGIQCIASDAKTGDVWVERCAPSNAQLWKMSGPSGIIAIHPANDSTLCLTKDEFHLPNVKLAKCKATPPCGPEGTTCNKFQLWYFDEWRTGNGRTKGGSGVLKTTSNELTIASLTPSVGCLTGWEIPFGVGGPLQVWATNLHGGDLGVVLLNKGEKATNITLTWTSVGLPQEKKMAIRDVWAHKNVGVFSKQWTADSVPSHGVTMIRLEPAAA